MTSTTVSTPTQTPRTWKKYAFYSVAVLFIGLLVFFTGIMIPALPYIVTGWTLSPDHSIHHLHEFVTSIFFWSLLVGAGAQFFNARTKAAPILQLVGAVLLMLVLSIVTNSFFPPLVIFLVLGLGILFLHPAGVRNLIRREGPVHLPLLALVAVGIIPVIYFAIDHLGMQAMHADEHAEFFHWGAVATIALCTTYFGSLAALRLSGWKITAWAAGLIAIVLGITGIAFPTQASSIGSLWGTLAIVWGAGFIAAAHLLKPRLN